MQKKKKELNFNHSDIMYKDLRLIALLMEWYLYLRKKV